MLAALGLPFTLGAPGVPKTALQPASQPAPQPASQSAPLQLARSPAQEVDAKTAIPSTSFLGPVLSSNCQPDNYPKNSTSWVVNNLPGGGYPRCYTAVQPQQHTRQLPVVIFLTGIGGGGDRCGPCCDDAENVESFGDLATNVPKTGGFALVCPEPLRFKGSGDPNGVWSAEMWDIPQPISDARGQRCSASRDYDLMLALVNDLSTRSHLDLDNLFIFGESLGAAAAAFWSVCIREALEAKGMGNAVKGYGMHSSGLKLKGDGIRMDAIPYDLSERFGECTGCQYYPIIPKKQPTKACVFGSPYDPLYGKTVAQFERVWQTLGNPFQMGMHENPYVAHDDPQQHCYWHSYSEMLTCLDNGEGSLLQGTMLAQSREVQAQLQRQRQQQAATGAASGSSES